jgi:hypothetical protein
MAAAHYAADAAGCRRYAIIFAFISRHFRPIIFAIFAAEACRQPPLRYYDAIILMPLIREPAATILFQPPFSLPDDFPPAPFSR